MHLRSWWKLSIALVVAGGVLWGPEALAYDSFSQLGGDATNCGACHGDFRDNGYLSNTDGLDWGNVHTLHRQSMVSGDCDTCHTAGSRFPVMINSSTGGTALSTISCVGCHGREEDNVAGNPDVPAMGGRGAGLRQHHHVTGVTVCATCHQDADPANYTPVGEDVLPDYYANPGTNHADMPTDPCNLAGSEDFAGDLEGLDNDGDDSYDAADPDCSTAVCGNGVPEAGEDCDDSGESATCDADCSSATCDDGTLNTTAGETCDPIASCPGTCDDGSACTADSQTGTAATCDLVCVNDPITSCTDGDGCCAPGCTSANDTDCASGGCGNAFTDGGEDCDDGGETATCDADCTFVLCDDGTLNVAAGETCDPLASCPASCDDADVCTLDVQAGDPSTCDMLCTNTAITACADGDGCCAPGCVPGNDDDCVAPVCGNGVVEAGEICDGDCPTTCDDADACTTDIQTGSVGGCDLVCVNAGITTCISGDGCCAAGCGPSGDDDCVASTCGDGLVEGGETCDGDCPASCDDGDLCTADTSTGSAGGCDLLCASTPVTACTPGDGCCAPGCTVANDSDCVAEVCGNGVLEGAEICDGNCPASCDDEDACTVDSSSGSAATCDLICINEPVTGPECGTGEPPEDGEGCECTAAPGAARPGAIGGIFLLFFLAILGRRRACP